METYTKLASTDADAQKVTVQNNSIPKSEYSASKIKKLLVPMSLVTRLVSKLDAFLPYFLMQSKYRVHALQAKNI